MHVGLHAGARTLIAQRFGAGAFAERIERRPTLRTVGASCEAAQRVDGSWEGSWGVCFTYGTWFGVLGLKAAGVTNGSPASSETRLPNSCSPMASGPDGSWGESSRKPAFDATLTFPSEHGQAVMTAWATLALIAAGHGKDPAVGRAVEFLRQRQGDDGSFPAEGIAGVFNKTCGIHYDNYLKIFPVWALATERCREPAHARTPKKRDGAVMQPVVRASQSRPGCSRS